MKWTCLTVISFCFFIVSLLLSDSANGSQLIGDGLGNEWSVTEGGVTGHWVRRGNSGTWDGNWANGAVAILSITIAGDKVKISRKDVGGPSTGLTATYEGALAADGSIQGIETITSPSQSTQNWQGRIVKGVQASQPTPTPAPTGDRTNSVVNLALHKPATQSSVYHGTGIDQGPQFGNDGILESQPRDPYLLVITDPNDLNPPWWQVDLQGVYTLTQLKLYNRKACCQDRAKTVQVLLSTDRTHWERAYAHNGTPFDVLTVDLTGRKARYVKLQLTERNSLNFQECEVYGYTNAPASQTIASQPPAMVPTIDGSTACSIAGDWVLDANENFTLSLRQAGSQVQGSLGNTDPMGRQTTPAPATGSISGGSLRLTISSGQSDLALTGSISPDCGALNLAGTAQKDSMALTFHRP